MYELNNSFGTHTVRVHLQDGEYKGVFEHKISGNCKGLDVLIFDIDNCDDDFYAVILKNEQGDTREYELDSAKFGRMVVAFEIIDFEEE